MNITAAELKASLKKLSPIKTETYQIGTHGLSAQDSEAWVIVDSPLSGLGNFSVNGKKLSSVVSRLSGTIDVSQSEKSILLKSAKAKVELETHPIKPLTLPAEPDKFASLPAKDFKQVLSVSSASASPNKSADFGNVVQVQTLPLGIEENSPSGLRVIGTDGNVLTVAKLVYPIPFEFNMLLNLTSVAVVQLMDGKIDLGETNQHVFVKSGDTRLWVSRSIKKYPGFDPLLNSTPKIRIGFKTEEWASALRTVEPLIDEEQDKGGVAGLFREGVVEWKNIGIGSRASDEAGYEQLEPDPIFEPKEFTLRINARYLSGFLSKAGEDATMMLTDTNKPVKIESGNVTVLMMPLRGSK